MNCIHLGIKFNNNINSKNKTNNELSLIVKKVGTFSTMLLYIISQTIVIKCKTLNTILS